MASSKQQEFFWGGLTLFSIVVLIITFCDLRKAPDYIKGKEAYYIEKTCIKFHTGQDGKLICDSLVVDTIVQQIFR